MTAARKRYRRGRERHPVIGRLRYWMAPAGIPDIGFREFTTDEVHGLARVLNPGVVDLLAVISLRPGTGAFRRFVCDLKRRYHTVRFLCIMEEIVQSALVRYGFALCDDSDGSGEVAMEWKQ